MTAKTTWHQLGAGSPPIKPVDLTSSRIELHWAAQVLGAVADALLPRAEDDSHTNLFWSDEFVALVGRPLGNGKRAGLAFDSFEIVCIEGNAVTARFALAGQTLAAALQWSQTATSAPTVLSVRDYDMPAHPVSDGATFAAAAVHHAELGRYFASATAVLTDFAARDSRATGVAVWPHHFDVGGIIFLEADAPAEAAKQIGFGLSPGDGTIAEPYFYITPWPIGETPELRPLDFNGTWHREGFTGALLITSELVKSERGAQRGQVEAYLSSAIAASESLIARA